MSQFPLNDPNTPNLTGNPHASYHERHEVRNIDSYKGYFSTYKPGGVNYKYLKPEDGPVEFPAVPLFTRAWYENPQRTHQALYDSLIDDEEKQKEPFHWRRRGRAQQQATRTFRGGHSVTFGEGDRIPAFAPGEAFASQVEMIESSRAAVGLEEKDLGGKKKEKEDQKG